MLRSCSRDRLSKIASIALPAFLALILGSSLLANRFLRANVKLLSFRSETNEVGADSISVFRIMQLTDLHLGENAWEDWGPLADRKTFAALERYLDHSNSQQLPIDLVVLSGDQLTANNVDANATLYYQRLAAFFNRRRIPFATIFGNHDDAPLERYNRTSGSVYKIPAKTSRQQLQRAIEPFTYSLSRQGPEYLPGGSNYWLSVATGNTKKGEPPQVALRIALMDTGGGTLDEVLTQDHMDWFRNETNMSPYNNSHVPIVVFQHIPTEDFRLTQENDGQQQQVISSCTGLQDDGVSPVTQDDGWIAFLQNNITNVQLVAVGHQHGNDYCCDYNDDSSNTTSHLSLCFGRHSGYGGYGSWDRGARIYEFHDNGDGNMDWISWVLLESGEIINSFQPSTS